MSKESDRIRNQLPKRKAYRKAYKQTESGKKANKKYRSKPEVRLKYENYRLKQRYGITIEERDLLYKKQKGKCAICGEEYKTLHVDHCHKTNVVRGLLCGKCNRGLGLFKDDVKLLNKAINYLKNGKLHKNNSSN